MNIMLKKAYDKARNHFPLALDTAEVADYIPELAKANPDQLAVSITDIFGTTTSMGDHEQCFTIQSIVKLILLALALEEKGEEFVFSRVGKEPTGDAFNSILRLETSENGLPSNPMINAGAISVCSCIPAANAGERFDKVLGMAKKMLGNNKIELDSAVYRSERSTGDRNRALAYMMQARGVYNENIDDLLDVYFKACSLLVTCKDLSYMAALLANDGKTPSQGNSVQIISKRNAQIIRALMCTAGMYDGSGEFAVDLGFPAKSGVGGGIANVIPGKMGIATFSPALDSCGNSYGGRLILNYLSKDIDLFVY